MRDGYGFNEGVMCFILSWFGVHQSILHSWGDISVLLVLWQSCWGLSRVQSSKSRILMCLIGKTQLQCKGNWPHLNLLLGTASNFAFLGWHQCSSRLVTVLLGTLWSSIKQIEAPYLFDWENTIALETMQGNRASSRTAGKVSWVFSSCGRNLGYILELQWGCPFETLVCSLKSGTCLGMRDNSGM